jgi:hypothetical protein
MGGSMDTKRILTILFAVAAVALPLSAGELEGVEFSDEISVDGKTLVLNGMGVRKKFGFKIYVAGLYLEKRSGDAEAILASGQTTRVVMHFLYKKVSAKKLTGAWDDGFENNLSEEEAGKHEAGLTELNGWMEEVVRGDTMTFTSAPGGGLAVSVKGQSKGVIAGDEFARAFWSVFLGPEPPTDALKEGLLGS